MAASLEILVSKTRDISVSSRSLPFKVVLSQPPCSHRGSASLWQRDFARDGGTLVHIGDPTVSEERGRFWAYEMLEEIECRRYRILPNYKRPFFLLIENLLGQSKAGKLLLTSDMQFGPQAFRYKRPLRVVAAEKIHDRYGLRLNSLMNIV